MEKTSITHLGKTFKTVHFSNITDKECEKIKEDFYKKPDFQLVTNQFNKLREGGKKTNYVIDYYFKDVMSKARLDSSKWSIEEFFNCNNLIRFAHGKIKNCSNFYKSTDSDIKNIKTVLRLSPSGTAGKVSNFPYKTMLEVFEKYNLNNNYYDFSCGWGIRLLSSMTSGVNYFGTDPNEELVDSLKLMSEDYFKNTLKMSSVDIRCSGSQEHIQEWDGKIGLAFSSPPYFDLEHYKSDNQSIEGLSYEQWLEEYWRKTVNNIEKYLIEGGHLLLNMKNIKKHNTLDDMCKIIEEKGFKFVENLELKNINRIILKNNGKNTNEVIAVFKKV
jgi:hypothetical protein